MDKLDNYEFDNPLEKIGIDNIFDIEALRKKASSLIVKIKDALLEQNKMSLDSLNQTLEDLKEKKSTTSGELISEYDKKIDEIKRKISSIQSQREKWYNELDQNSVEVYSTDDISAIIYRIIKLCNIYLMFKQKDDNDKDFRIIVNDLKSSLKSVEDVREFLMKKVFITNYIDVEQRDLSRYEYKGKGINSQGFPDYYCVAKPTEEPQKLLDIRDKTGDRVQVYKIGRYAFRQIPIKENHYVYTSGEYELLTVLRYSKNGELKTYNGVIEDRFNDISKNPNFYGVVVFSEYVMENAEKNNFGYIGNVYIDNDHKKRLGFEGNVETRDLVTSLSYIQKYEGRFFNLPNCKTIQDFYDIMNQKVQEISDIEKSVGPNLEDDEGRK